MKKNEKKNQKKKHPKTKQSKWRSRTKGRMGQINGVWTGRALNLKSMNNLYYYTDIYSTKLSICILVTCTLIHVEKTSCGKRHAVFAGNKWRIRLTSGIWTLFRLIYARKWRYRCKALPKIDKELKINISLKKSVFMVLLSRNSLVLTL